MAGNLSARTSREEAETKLAQYRLQRVVVVAAFDVALQALALAATANDDPSFDHALRAVRIVLEATKTFTGGGTNVNGQ